MDSGPPGSGPIKDQHTQSRVSVHITIIFTIMMTTLIHNMEHIAEWPTQHIHSLSSLCLLPLQRLEKLKPHFPKLPCSEAEGGPLMYLRLTKLSDQAQRAAGSRRVDVMTSRSSSCLGHPLVL